MLKSIKQTSLVFPLFLLTLFVGCSQSEEQVIAKADEIAASTFTETEKINPNNTINSLSIYLPEYIHLVEKDENNIILENKHHTNTYIIFINHLEKPTSQMNFELANNNNTLLYKSYEREDMFGYIRILSVTGEDENYQLQIGIGGVKITTNIPLKKIISETEELMKIAKSINEANFL